MAKTLKDILIEQRGVEPTVKQEPVNPLKKAIADNNKYGATDVQLGQYGTGESKYDNEINPGNVTNLNEIRAQRQGALDKWGNGLVKAAGIAGDINTLRF